MTRWFAFDPLPPPGAVSIYDQAYFEGVDTSAVGGIGTGGWEDGFEDEDGVLRDPGLMERMRVSLFFQVIWRCLILVVYSRL